MTATALDIVIVTFNTWTELDACLRSLTDAPPALPHRIHVVDNASSDGTAARLRERWPGVAVHALERNVGFGAGNNVALRAGTAPLALLLNSDTLVPPGAIDRLAERLHATGCVAAGPRLVDERGRPELSFGPMLSPGGELFQFVAGRLASSRWAWAREIVERRLAEERDVDWVSGACLIVRRDRAAAAGFFDERFFMYEEDVDFCATLRAAGGRILFTPRAEIVHLHGRSFGTGGRAAARHAIYDRSHLAFYEKHAPRWAPVLRLWLRLRGRGIR